MESSRSPEQVVQVGRKADAGVADSSTAEQVGRDLGVSDVTGWMHRRVSSASNIRQAGRASRHRYVCDPAGKNHDVEGRMRTSVRDPVATKGIVTYALFGGLAAGFAGIIVLNYGGLTPSLIRIGSSGWFAVLVMAFMTGYVDTCVGGGHGTLLTPSLVLLGFPSKIVVPGILLSEIGIGILATILNCRAGNIHLARGEQHRHVLLVLSACSLVGSIIAVTVAVKLSPSLVNALIGLVIIAAGLLVLTRCSLSKRFSMRWILFLGTLAAFNKGISGGGYGPLLTSGQVLSGVGEKGAVSITPPARGLTGLISVMLYFMANGTIEASLALPLITGSLLAMPAAVFTVTKIDAGVLRKGITVATVALGTLLVVNALH